MHRLRIKWWNEQCCRIFFFFFRVDCGQPDQSTPQLLYFLCVIFPLIYTFLTLDLTYRQMYCIYAYCFAFPFKSTSMSNPNRLSYGNAAKQITKKRNNCSIAVIHTGPVHAMTIPSICSLYIFYWCCQCPMVLYDYQCKLPDLMDFSVSCRHTEQSWTEQMQLQIQAIAMKERKKEKKMPCNYYLLALVRCCFGGDWHRMKVHLFQIRMMKFNGFEIVW